ncbi:hypothetical protein [uncultured Microbacterium sp.]|uniref:hypothetical protein n=1 Tax=uncultured Microbacterium sp. TaxID=191216 RepID=UPI0025D04ED2|nr:hypothetical protein [uncultured Microbacterium sp.]
MTRVDPAAILPHAVLALLDAADADTLLRDAEGLADGLTDAGWTPEVESGRFGADGWDIVSSAWAPGLSAFLDGDVHEVRTAALAIAAALVDGGDRWSLDTEGPSWSAWSVEDPRWRTDEIDWLVWSGRGVVVSLYTAPEMAAGPGVLPAHLQLAISRADTPDEGLARDEARDRRVAAEGSVVERWYLAGHEGLSDELLARLEADDDGRVSAAAASERLLRDDSPRG